MKIRKLGQIEKDRRAEFMQRATKPKAFIEWREWHKGKGYQLR